MMTQDVLYILSSINSKTNKVMNSMTIVHIMDINTIVRGMAHKYMCNLIQV
jgi:hypothetical protein